ncbi:MAG: hypothetical protein ABI364_03800 [Caldimonas sp.]
MAGGGDEPRRLVPARRVAVIRWLEKLRRVGSQAGDGADLRHRAVGVVIALHGEDRCLDPRHFGSMFQSQNAVESHTSLQPPKAVLRSTNYASHVSESRVRTQIRGARRAINCACG